MYPKPNNDLEEEASENMHWKLRDQFKERQDANQDKINSI